MTLRLVASMSVVLLLSLGAFGLLIDHYQGQVMIEVARTASDVGRATLRTLDLAEHAQHPLVLGLGSQAMVWQDHVGGPAAPEAGAERGQVMRRIVVTSFDGPMRELSSGPARGGAADLARRSEIDEVEVSEYAFETRFEVDCEGADPPCGLAPGQEPEHAGTATFFIDVDAVRAEADGAGGYVLTIPKLTPTDEAELDDSWTPDPQAEGRALAREEIRLPIDVGHYQTLFDRVRGRSLAVLFGVFAVGTVLSTGLATRFTRPIRKLDAGIRRLSAGDLDVTVPVEGRDEVGRLARAFNEMAGKLRANRDREREMVRREKLSALGRLAAGVAHDVRNPLHSIGLTLQHLKETARPEDPDRADEFERSLGIIRGEIRRLDTLVGNFLGFARSERHERERVDLAALLREVARLIQKEAERRAVELVLTIADDVPAVAADPEGLRSAMLNLVLNALEAMPHGGRLTLQLSSEPGKAVFEVADTGEGIADEHREHVFDFAYTTRDGGTGLGLAMVHHCVVEEHGGRIWLDSRPGQGTSVRIALPAEPELRT